MMVLVLTASPAGLRGDLTKWLLEVSPGVFVGNVNAKIREGLWKRVTALCKDGRALLIYSSNNEQGMEFLVHDHSWEPVDIDGITVMRRPAAKRVPSRRTGWSTARGQRRSRRPAWSRREGAEGGDESAPETG